MQIAIAEQKEEVGVKGQKGVLCSYLGGRVSSKRDWSLDKAEADTIADAEEEEERAESLDLTFSKEETKELIFAVESCACDIALRYAFCSSSIKWEFDELGFRDCINLRVLGTGRICGNETIIVSPRYFRLIS